MRCGLREAHGEDRAFWQADRDFAISDANFSKLVATDFVLENASENVVGGTLILRRIPTSICEGWETLTRGV